MDKIEPDYSQYDVMYYEYLTATKKYVDHHFVIGNLQRAQWLRNLLLDVQIMVAYDQYEEWPMHGESCTAYNRACQFLDVCTMTTTALTMGHRETRPALELDTKGGSEQVQYDVYVSFEELVQGQLARV